MHDHTSSGPAHDAATARPAAVSRRALIGGGFALVGASMLAGVGTASKANAATGALVRNLTGPSLTGQFSANYTDLAIPAQCPDGSVIFICGDTFTSQVGGSDWRSPIALRSSAAAPASITINGAVGGSHATQLIPYAHDNGVTALPSDVFTVGSSMYMHVMRGKIFQPTSTELWRSNDNGNTWTNLCSWDAALYGKQFQQKTYAVADNGYCYVLTSIFDRATTSALYLFRVPQSQLGTPSAYQPWGLLNGSWNWGNPPTTVSPARRWGEICFRAMGGKYALTWLNMDSSPVDIRAQIFPLPTSNLSTTPEQIMIVNGSTTAGNQVQSPYGGFIFPGSTFADFNIAVSQWPNNSTTNYHVMQYRVTGLTS